MLNNNYLVKAIASALVLASLLQDIVYANPDCLQIQTLSRDIVTSEPDPRALLSARLVQICSPSEVANPLQVVEELKRRKICLAFNDRGHRLLLNFARARFAHGEWRIPCAARYPGRRGLAYSAIVGAAGLRELVAYARKHAAIPETRPQPAAPPERPKLVIGAVRYFVDRKLFEDAYRSADADALLGASAASEDAPGYWLNKTIRDLMIPHGAMPGLYDSSFRYLTNGRMHPDVDALRDTLRQLGIPFEPTEEPGASGKEEARYGSWPKDRSFLIPAAGGVIPFPGSDRYAYPVGGELVAVPGAKPILLVSDAAPERAALDRLQGMYPNVAVRTVPKGFVTLRFADGRDVLMSTTHIDCVINAIPPAATTHGRPVILVDPRYYRELTLRPDMAALLEELRDAAHAIVVVVPEEEAYLNPANFALLGQESILLNRALETRRLLVEAGVRDDAVHLMDRPVTDLALLDGSIGCLAGLFQDDGAAACPAAARKRHSGKLSCLIWRLSSKGRPTTDAMTNARERSCRS